MKALTFKEASQVFMLKYSIGHVEDDLRETPRWSGRQTLRGLHARRTLKRQLRRMRRELKELCT